MFNDGTNLLAVANRLTVDPGLHAGASMPDTVDHCTSLCSPHCVYNLNLTRTVPLAARSLNPPLKWVQSNDLRHTLYTSGSRPDIHTNTH